MAEKSISSSAYDVSMMTLMFGYWSTICSQASIPDVPGSRMSITTTSGSSSGYLFQRITRRTCLPHDFELWVSLQQRLQPQADNLMIVHQYDPLFCH